MIALLIVGVLIVVAAPVCQGYVACSQVHRAYSELAAYKSAVEGQLCRGSMRSVM